jgi:hypothetical protein
MHERQAAAAAAGAAQRCASRLASSIVAEAFQAERAARLARLHVSGVCAAARRRRRSQRRASALAGSRELPRRSCSCGATLAAAERRDARATAAAQRPPAVGWRGVHAAKSARAVSRDALLCVSLGAHTDSGHSAAATQLAVVPQPQPHSRRADTSRYATALLEEVLPIAAYSIGSPILCHRVCHRAMPL